MTNVDDLFGNVEMGTVITCPVCRDIYNLTDRTPINIPCGHTICTQCLNALIARGGPPVLMCPVCRKRHDLHQTPGGNLSRFPKNFQLLEVVEKVIQLKEKNNHSLDRFTSFRDCKNKTSESSCTQCSCVKDLPNGEVDFMNRPKSTLTLHKDRDISPICAMKAEFENIMREVKCKFDRIREKSETAKQAFDNSNEKEEVEETEENRALAELYMEEWDEYPPISKALRVEVDVFKIDQKFDKFDQEVILVEDEDNYPNLYTDIDAVVEEPQGPDVAVEVQAADPAPMRRRGGANQQGHDSIQREAQNTRGNARIRRPAHRFGDAQLE